MLPTNPFTSGVVAYDPPMYRCSQCGYPCTGVMCLSCATE